MLKLVNEVDEFSELVFKFPRTLETHQFESRGEFACASLLEKYVKGWSCEQGRTYQVPIGFGRKIDFKIGETFVEYHPIVFSREFEDRVAYRNFDSALQKIPSHWRHQIKEAIFNELLERYFKKRKFIIDANEQTKGSELLVCHSPQTFCSLVLKRFGQGLPKLKELILEFKQKQQS